jgi:hypothetical protein
MKQPLIDLSTEFAVLLQDVPRDFESLAYQSKAFSFGRKVKNVRQLLWLVLLYCGLDKVLRELAALFTLRYDISIEDQSIGERLEKCVEWVKLLVLRTLEEVNVHSLQCRRLLVVDGTVIDQHTRLHLCMELKTLQYVELLVTDKHRGESLKNFSFVSGDIVFSDSGYTRLDPIFDSVSRGVDLITRHHYTNVPVHDLDAEPINFERELKGLEEGEVKTIPIQIFPSQRQKDRKPLKAWLHCRRLSEQKANEARRKCRSDAKRKRNSTPQELTLFLCGFIIVLTTISPEQLSGKIILKLYIIRWQIELGIKRFKSLIKLKEFRAPYNGELGSLWVYGKLFYAFLIEARLRRQLGDLMEAVYLHSDRTLSIWRPTKLSKAQIDSLLLDASAWTPSAWGRALKVLAERPRRRKLHRLHPKILKLQATLPPPQSQASSTHRVPCSLAPTG